MRIYAQLSSSTELVDFNHQHKLVGALHKWLGPNSLHGDQSLYSFSSLTGGKNVGKGLSFGNGASLFFSFHDKDVAKQLVKGILNDPEFCYGMRVVDVAIEEVMPHADRSVFYPGSPIFIKRDDEHHNKKHFTYLDDCSGELMVETLRKKMEVAGLPYDETLSIKFDSNAVNPKTKLITYRGIKNKVNLCPVCVEAKDYTKEFIWNVGLGNSTGIGFGAIK